MDKLILDEAKRLNDTCVTEEHRKLHAANVSACMEAMAEHFGEDPEHWAAVGCLHDLTMGNFRTGISPTQRSHSALQACRRKIQEHAYAARTNRRSGLFAAVRTERSIHERNQ